MRTGQLVGTNDMRCVEAEIPALRTGEMLVRTDMASICGSDLHVVCHGAGVAHPMPCPHGYPGHEAIGEVVDAGETAVEVGAHVLCFPPPPVSEGFSEFQRILPKYTLPLPEGADPAELLMAQQLGTVIFAAAQVPLKAAGATAVILGQGSAGLFWAWWLKRLGAERVIVADRVPARLGVSNAFGADVALNVDEDNLAEAVADLTADGADLVVEAVGRQETLEQSIELVRPDGDLMWFGLPDSDDPVPVSYSKFFRKRLTAWSTYGAQDEVDSASFSAALEAIAAGEIDVTPLMSHVYPVDEIATAFAVANEPLAAEALKVSVSFG